jgi:hypothetical protein
MLGTPNSGSEIATASGNSASSRFSTGRTTAGDPRDATIAGFPSITLSNHRGNRSVDPIMSAFLPKPHDGRVSVENTRLDGMADHIIVGTSHPWLVRNGRANQAIAFVRDGSFRRS